MKKYIILLLLVVPAYLTAQTKVTISGMVISATDNEPLIGVTVTEKGMNNTTVTDMNGNYTLQVFPKAVVKVSMIGFATQEISVAKDEIVNIIMHEEARMLDHVVVIGYGSVKKSDLTSSGVNLR
jgi:hypothetical protein